MSACFHSLALGCTASPRVRPFPAFARPSARGRTVPARAPPLPLCRSRPRGPHDRPFAGCARPRADSRDCLQPGGCAGRADRGSVGSAGSSARTPSGHEARRSRISLVKAAMMAICNSSALTGLTRYAAIRSYRQRTASACRSAEVSIMIVGGASRGALCELLDERESVHLGHHLVDEHQGIGSPPAAAPSQFRDRRRSAIDRCGTHLPQARSSPREDTAIRFVVVDDEHRQAAKTDGFRLGVRDATVAFCRIGP